MKTAKKALLLVLCAIALVVASVLGTLAYLQDQTEVVVNTMTVGMVNISLDEAKVDVYGTPIQNADRVIANNYKLIPGHEYTKDPKVTVDKDSEDAFIYVKVENQIADIEAAGTNGTIAAQLTANGWTALPDVSNVYYRSHKLVENAAANVEYKVFESFKIDGTVNGGERPEGVEDGKYIADYNNATVKVTAYAVQSDGFNEDPVEAWTAANFS